MKISIIGAGNGGCAFAARLAQLDIPVLLYADENHAKNITAIREQGGLYSEGVIEGLHRGIETTTDLSHAIFKADLILVAIPSFAQDVIFDKMINYIEDRQTIIFLPGNFSSFVFSSKMKTNLIKHKINLIECTTFPIGSRVNRIGCVTIYAYKQKISLGTHFSTIPSSIISLIEKIFPNSIEWCCNTLEIGMTCLNGVVHPATAVLNSGWIETTSGNFYFYKEGMSQSVCNVLEGIDKERIHIASLLNLKLQPFSKVIDEFYGIKCTSIHEFASNSPIHNSVKVCPENLFHRYLTEDVPYILVPWYEIGRLCSYEPTVIGSIINLASTLNQKDYLKEGRNARKMGLDNYEFVTRYMEKENLGFVS